MIRYWGTSPKLGGSQGECPYPILNFLWWWRRWWWWWSDPILKDQEILQSTDDAPEMDDMLLMQNIFASEILILYANYFNDAKSFNLSRGKMSKVGLKDIFFLLLGQQCLCCHRGWIYSSFLALATLTASISSSLFVSIFISEASSSMLLEEEEDMMPGLIDLTENNKKRE